MTKYNFQQMCGMHPDCSSGIGRFSWRKMKYYTGEMGDPEAFKDIYVVCAFGLFQTKEDGRISSVTPIRYCFDRQEAIGLAAKLNAIQLSQDGCHCFDEQQT